MKISAINYSNYSNAQKAATFAGKKSTYKEVFYRSGDKVVRSVVYPRNERDEAHDMFWAPRELVQFKDKITGVPLSTDLFCDEYKQYCEDEDDYLEYLREHDE